MPLVGDRGYALVPVRLGKGPLLWFVLDTAASRSVIASTTRARLGLGKAVESVAVTGGSGRAQYERVRLPTFRFGGETFADLHAIVADLSAFENKDTKRAIDGIIGQDVLRRFDYALDLPKVVLRLAPRGKSSPDRLVGAASCVANIADSDGWVRMQVRVNGSPAHAIVDTGAARSILNWRAAEGAGIKRDTPGVERSKNNAQGLGGGAGVEAFVHTFRQVQAGPVSFTPAPSSIADMPVFAALGLAERASMIFGTNYMTDRPMAVFYDSKRICFGAVVGAKRKS